MTRGMRVFWVVAAILVALGLIAAALGGCGSKRTERPPEVRDHAELTRMQGVLNDQRGLPDGFSPRPLDGWISPFRARGRDCRAVLDAAAGRPPSGSLRAQAKAAYAGNGVGEVAGVALAGYSPGGAQRHLDHLSTALARCLAKPQKLLTAKNPGNSTKLTMRELSIADVGHKALTAKVTGRLNGYPYSLHLVFVRIGETLICVIHTGFADLDPTRTHLLARAVADRVASA
ncbi:hypothetical protein SAMN05421505_102186 [Sinosporangium album]|uniref:PknH-like extracellular domain-containing protein n=1 Tax=Sinosporangium album TaxID=504805 RepID=A0A1G7S6C8_9ACTN|nr:hypothetical protein [Sinosporangium album]SDG18577.1 hypothetical protein SAMN05421505_102186 [Sinosporangium album]